MQGEMGRVKMGRNGWRRRGLGVIAAGSLAGSAMAQFSESYNFLKAVRDQDGAKVTAALDKPGNSMLTTYDEGSGETALDIVIKRRDQTYLSFFLGRGADPNLRDRNGTVPIMLATQLGWPEGVTLLLRSGANINAANNKGETPLIVAVHQHDVAMARLLVGNGADPRHGDRVEGKSALDYATEDPRGGPLVKVMQDAKPQAQPKVFGPSPN